MKKNVTFIPLLLAILLLFSGCVIIPLDKKFVYDAENVASVEVYYIEGDYISISHKDIDEADPFCIRWRILSYLKRSKGE